MKLTSAIHTEVAADALQAAMTSFLLTVMEFLLAGIEERNPKCTQDKGARFYWILRLWYEYGKAGEYKRNDVIAMTIEHEVPVDMRGTIRGDWARVKSYFGDSTRYSVLNPATLVFGILANCLRVFAKKGTHAQNHCFSLDQIMVTFVLLNEVMGTAEKERNGFDKKSVAAMFSSMPSADTLALAILFGADQFNGVVMELATRGFDEQPSFGGRVLETVGLGPALHSGLFPAGGDEGLVYGGEPIGTGHKQAEADNGSDGAPIMAVDVVAQELPRLAG